MRCKNNDKIIHSTALTETLVGVGGILWLMNGSNQKLGINDYFFGIIWCFVPCKLLTKLYSIFLFIKLEILPGKRERVELLKLWRKESQM